MASSIYISLEKEKDIRLLKIEAGDLDEKISCTLEKASLNKECSYFAPYFALSYCWGDPKKTKPIICNGITFNATENLIAAMRRLRASYPSQTFWIDAICINQGDSSEKARQVHIMCDIYQSADKVVIYLGTEFEGLDRAMGLFQMLKERSDDPISANNNARLIRDSLPLPFEEVWYRLGDFYNLPWFSRVWIIQEVTMASMDPVVLCGSFTLSWADMAKVALFLREIALTAATQVAIPIATVLLIKHSKEIRQRLISILTKSLHFKSTDPRDKIFAFYGIVNSEDQRILNSPYFEVSYTKSVKTIYQNLMIGYFHNFGSVDLIFHATSSSYDSTIEGLPSWVPDWSIPYEYQTSSLASCSAISGYEASGGRAAQKDFSKLPDVLRIVGKSHDHVAWVAESFQDGDLALLPHMRSRPQTLERLWNQVSSRLRQSNEIKDAFWRTLMGNVDRNWCPLGPEVYKYFLCFWHQSKTADQSAIEYRATHASEPPWKDEIQQRRLFEIAAREEQTTVTRDEYENFQRYTTKLALSASPCLSNGPVDVEETKQNLREILSTKPANWDLANPKCLHCFFLFQSEIYIETGFWEVKGSSPALAYRETDPFIADYYHYLEDDFGLAASDHNMHCFAHLLNILKNRAFFITSNGSMGLGPSKTKPGDQVVILSGASVPALLRLSEEPVLVPEISNAAASTSRSIGRYQVIGEAYVHGIMGGEAIKDFDWDKNYEYFDLI